MYSFLRFISVYILKQHYKLTINLFMHFNLSFVQGMDSHYLDHFFQ